MMWISGVAASEVCRAFIAAGAALLIFGVPASLQQQRYSPILKNASQRSRIDWAGSASCRVLVAAIAANVV